MCVGGPLKIWLFQCYKIFWFILRNIQLRKYLLFCYSYDNITVTLKREWYNFQLEANEFVDSVFGDGLPDDEVEENSLEKVDDDYDDG